jgi:transposase
MDMRGRDTRNRTLFSYVSPEARVPEAHPLRGIRTIVNRALESLSPLFESLYSSEGRPSVPPEQLLRALLIQILYSVRSERMLMEQLGYNLLFRWFVGLSMDEPVWVPSVFSKNRDRLLEGDVARQFLARTIEEANRRGLMSEEHFTVDGTLLKAWASHKSVKPIDNGKEPPCDTDSKNETVDFRGEKRTNETHRSTTDPEARLYRKGDDRGAELSYMDHVLMENRNGLVSDAEATQATGHAEREAAVRMVENIPGTHPVTVGADKAYDTKDFVEDMRNQKATPHVARNTSGRRSAIDGRTTRHAGYHTSQAKRKRVEEIFGWMKTVGLLRQLRHRGCEAIDWIFKFTAAAYNLTRLRNLENAA